MPKTRTLTRLKNWVFRPSQEIIVYQDAHPQQQADATNYLWAPHPDLVPLMIQYALNHFVYTAVNKLTSICAAANFLVTSRPDGMQVNHSHPLAQLLGRYGKPSRDMDSYEFWESHFQNLILAGNSYWLWESDDGGAPQTVIPLEPPAMRIRPGHKDTVGQYTYSYNGVEKDYQPVQITHFKRANPYSRYYGLSALQALSLAVQTDNHMLRWNASFFDPKLALPSGMIIMPSNTSDAELARIQAEFTAKHGEKRRVAFVRADAGKSVWIDAALKHKDYDFTEGRILTRQNIYEALDIPLGVMAETSTEAHAIIALSQLMWTAHTWHERTTRKLNTDGLDFWSQPQKWQCEFEDVRRQAVDWRRESLRRAADERIMTIDEIRMREYNLPAIAGETAYHANTKRIEENTPEPG